MLPGVPSGDSVTESGALIENPDCQLQPRKPLPPKGNHRFVATVLAGEFLAGFQRIVFVDGGASDACDTHPGTEALPVHYQSQVGGADGLLAMAEDAVLESAFLRLFHDEAYLGVRREGFT